LIQNVKPWKGFIQWVSLPTNSHKLITNLNPNLLINY
jgi:hypothetical protein